MKIEKLQNYSQIYSTGLTKSTRTHAVNIINNPTEEALKEAELRFQKQIKDMGLVVLKEVKLFVQHVNKSPVKTSVNYPQRGSKI